MSAHARPEPRRAPPPFLRDLPAAGGFSTVLVALAGATLGFFVWYAVLVPHHDPILGELDLLVSVATGAVGAVWAWLGYARYVSRRSGATLARSLRYDAFTWLPFLALWGAFVLPPQYAHGTRLFVIALGVFCVAKVLIAARYNQTVREVLLDFVATRVAIIVIAELAAAIVGQRPGSHVEESSHALLAVWGRWDAVHYLNIATVGYHGTDMAFFPLFPLLIRIFGSLAGNHLIAGLVISNACFFFGLLFLYKLLEREYDRSTARRAIFYVSIFPSAVFFSAVYTESLLLMVTGA